MRYAGIALLCVVAAFGAAFLIRRSVDHHGTARTTLAGDTRTGSSQEVTATVGSSTTSARRHSSALGSQFAPSLSNITRRAPKAKPRHHHHASSTSASQPSVPVQTETEPTYTPPSEPTSSGSGTSHSSGSHHSGGTGTTSIGGRGSGTTTIGG